jgi:hypothetical protein
MKQLIGVMAIAVLSLAVAMPAIAAEKTLDGTLVCAKCHLKKADAAECQDVLIVAGDDGQKTEYYVTKNAVAQASGEACTLEIKATVTGDVSEKDGRLWITPSKIVKK